MPDYTVSENQLNSLNVMIDVGGHIPSAVSDALADAQIAQAAGNQSALTSALNRAIAANIQSGKAWSNVQAWHDDIKDEDPPGPPPVTGYPVDPIPADSVTRVFRPFPAGQKVASHAGQGAGRFFSFTAPSGNILGKIWVNGVLLIDGNLDRVPVVPGDLIEWQLDSPAFQDECRYSINN